MARHPNHRLVKIHRSYTTDEVARCLGVHRNTVSRWIKGGLPTTDQKRPLLIHGPDLAEFLRARRLKHKRTCQPGQIYCLRCREPRHPAGGFADYEPVTGAAGNLVGICPECDCVMYRRVNLAKLEQVRGNVDVTLRQELSRIGEST